MTTELTPLQKKIVEFLEEKCSDSDNLLVWGIAMSWQAISEYVADYLDEWGMELEGVGKRKSFDWVFEGKRFDEIDPELAAASRADWDRYQSEVAAVVGAALDTLNEAGVIIGDDAENKKEGELFTVPHWATLVKEKPFSVQSLGLFGNRNVNE